MHDMNLSEVRLRKKQRLVREKKALRDTLCAKLQNEQTANNNGVVANCIRRLRDKDDLCLFDRFSVCVVYLTTNLFSMVANEP